MAQYRENLPQIGGNLFLADGGIETDLIFNRNIPIREFASHTLLSDVAGREAVRAYFRPFLDLARACGTGFVLDSQTWKAHLHWADALGATEDELRAANRESIAFIAQLRDECSSNAKPIVLNGIIGPRGDAYSPESGVAAHEAEQYHARQIGWLAETDVDMITATTFTQASEAVGFVRAAEAAGLPAVVSFTVEVDGSLPSGQPLGEAIDEVDQATGSSAAYFMVNCAHPDHFFHEIRDAAWARRLRGIRCNASRRSHAELDASETLDAGNPSELGQAYAALRRRMPWLNVFGGCCGTDLRHVNEIARAVTA
jgi:homocysteine S-methyltransferase